MTLKKDAVGNNPLSNLIPRGPASRPSAPAPVATEPIKIAPAVVLATPAAASAPAVAEPSPGAPTVVAPATMGHSVAAPAAAAPADEADDGAPDASDAAPLKRCTVRLPVALLERMTSAIVHTPGMTQADFVAEALVAHLASLEKERGSAFPVYGKRLRPGRKSW